MDEPTAALTQHESEELYRITEDSGTQASRSSSSLTEWKTSGAWRTG
jgi:hypothetical protein